MPPSTPSAGHVKPEHKEIPYMKKTTKSHVVVGTLPKACWKHVCFLEFTLRTAVQSVLPFCLLEETADICKKVSSDENKSLKETILNQV